MKKQLLKKTFSLLPLLIACGLSAGAQNLLTQDPSFEEGSGPGLNYQWYTGGAGTKGTTTRETATPQAGLANAKAVTTVAGNYYDFGISNFQKLNETTSPVLEAGKTYTISFYYKNSGGHSFRVGLQDNSGAPPYDFFKEFTGEASTWTLGTFEFTANAALVANTNDVRLKFEFGKDLGTTEIDNVKLVSATPPPPSANLVLNPSFEQGSGSSFTNWTAYGNPAVTAANAAPEDGLRYVRADVTTGGTGNAYDVQFLSDDFAVVPGHAYAISFWYKSNKTIRVLTQSTNTYNAIADIPASATPTVWVKFEQTWTYPADKTDLQMSLKFHLNLDNGFAEIDNVSVKDLSQLPVTLSSFTAKTTPTSVRVNWISSSEKNADFYQLLKSEDGRNFRPLFKIGAKNEAANYLFTDNEPAKGINYYQLLQYDKDGKMKDFGVRAVNFSLNLTDELSIYPNPVTNQFSFSLGAYVGNFTVTVSELSGRNILVKNVNTQGAACKVQLPAGLASGVYTLNVTGEGLNKTKKFLVK
ncbi:MAG TPA: carbohydrate binding domain-containing protein [Pelobium sp.]